MRDLHFLRKVLARSIADSVEVATPNQQKIVLYIHQEEQDTQKNQSLWQVKVDKGLRWEQM